MLPVGFWTVKTHFTLIIIFKFIVNSLDKNPYINVKVLVANILNSW
jgi:hypothetical protein